jgi:hypothetical protein
MHVIRWQIARAAIAIGALSALLIGSGAGLRW